MGKKQARPSRSEHGSDEMARSGCTCRACHLEREQWRFRNPRARVWHAHIGPVIDTPSHLEPHAQADELAPAAPKLIVPERKIVVTEGPWLSAADAIDKFSARARAQRVESESSRAPLPVKGTRPYKRWLREQG